MAMVASYPFTVDNLNKTVDFEVSNAGGGVEPFPLEVTENGTYYAPAGKAYNPVTVNVAGLVPTGQIEITENGTHDVTEYAEAVVNVKTYAEELAGVVEGTATELRDLPVSKIKPYAFYSRNAHHLPAGYEELEYIESTGTQYVLANFGFVLNTSYRIIIEMVGTIYNDGVGIGWNAGGGVLMRGNKYSNGTTSGTTTIDGSQRVIVTIDIGTGGTSDYTFSDTNGSILATLSRSNGSLRDWSHINYPLFATSGSTATPPSLLYYVGRIYRFSAYMGGALLSDFIPVSHNGAVGFYNTVDSNFYGNSGSGSLIGGPIVPRDETVTIETADLTVDEIGEYAFFNNELHTLILRGEAIATLGDHALDGTPIANGTGRIYVPAELVDAYKTADGWSAYASVISAI